MGGAEETFAPFPTQSFQFLRGRGSSWNSGNSGRNMSTKYWCWKKLIIEIDELGEGGWRKVR